MQSTHQCQVDGTWVQYSSDHRSQSDTVVAAQTEMGQTSSSAHPNGNFAPLMSKETEKSSSDENQEDRKELHALLRELRLLCNIKQAALKDERRELAEWESFLKDDATELEGWQRTLEEFHEKNPGRGQEDPSRYPGKGRESPEGTESPSEAGHRPKGREGDTPAATQGQRQPATGAEKAEGEGSDATPAAGYRPTGTTQGQRQPAAGELPTTAAERRRREFTPAAGC